MKNKLKALLFSIYSGLNRFPKTFDGVRILLYHEIDAVLFKKHVQFLTNNYTVLSMSDFLDQHRRGIPLKNTFVITFDDGWRSNYYLKDIFKEFDIMPTIYLTGYVDSTRPFWFHNLNQLDLIKLLTLSNKERELLLAENHEGCVLEAIERNSLNKQEIEDLIDYVDFQPHTWSHPALTKCTNEELRMELLNSFDLVKELTGLSPRTFAPPFGIYDVKVIDLLKEMDIEACVSITPGTNSLEDDLYNLKRIGIPSNCQINEFVARTSGFWDTLRSTWLLKPLSSFYMQYYGENS